jgi:hypothetical protein
MIVMNRFKVGDKVQVLTEEESREVNWLDLQKIKSV